MGKIKFHVPAWLEIEVDLQKKTYTTGIFIDLNDWDDWFVETANISGDAKEKYKVWEGVREVIKDISPKTILQRLRRFGWA